VAQEINNKSIMKMYDAIKYFPKLKKGVGNNMNKNNPVSKEKLRYSLPIKDGHAPSHD